MDSDELKKLIEQSWVHDPVKVELEVMTFKRASDSLEMAAFVAHGALIDFIVIYDLNLKLLNNLKTQITKYISENQKYFDVLDDRNSSNEEKVRAELKVNPKLNSYMRAVDRVEFQFIYIFSQIFEDVMTAFQRQYDAKDRETGESFNRQGFKNEILSVEVRNKRYQKNWIRRLKAATNFSRHYGDWSLILDEVRIAYGEKISMRHGVAKDARIYVPLVFKEVIAELKIKYQKINKNKVQGLENFLLLGDDMNVMIQLVSPSHMLAASIIKSLKLQKFHCTVRRINHWTLAIEKVYWKSYFRESK